MLPSLLTVPLGSLVLLSYTKMAAAQTTGLNSNSPAPRHFASGSDARQPRSINAMKSDADALGHLAFEGAAKRALPQPRMHATLTGVGSRLYLFGGTAEVEQPSRSFYLNELHVFDAHHGDWSDELSRPWCCEHNVVVDGLDPRPAPRTQHAAAAVGSVFVFGADGPHGLQRRAAEPHPVQRVRGGRARAQGDVRLRAGRRPPQLYLNDLHVFDTLTHSWTGKKAVVGAPSPRASHAMVAIGGDGGRPSSSSSSYSTTARSSAASVNAGALRERSLRRLHRPLPALYVFGGRSGSQLLNDLHRLDTGRMEWTHIDVSSSARSAVPSPHYRLRRRPDRFVRQRGPVAGRGHHGAARGRRPRHVRRRDRSHNRGGIDVEVGNWGDGDHHNDSAAAVAVPLGGLSLDTVSGQWELRGLGRRRSPCSSTPRPSAARGRSKVATAAFSSSSLDSSIPTSSKGGTSSMNVKERDGERPPAEPRFNHALVAIPRGRAGGADGYGYSMRGGGDACRRAQKRVTLGGGYGAGRSSSTDNTGCGWGSLWWAACTARTASTWTRSTLRRGPGPVAPQPHDGPHGCGRRLLRRRRQAHQLLPERVDRSHRRRRRQQQARLLHRRGCEHRQHRCHGGRCRRAAAAAAAANEAAAPGSASGAGSAAAAATMSTNMAAVQAGRWPRPPPQ